MEKEYSTAQVQGLCSCHASCRRCGEKDEMFEITVLDLSFKIVIIMLTTCCLELWGYNYLVF